METKMTYHVVQEKFGNKWNSIIYPPTSLSLASGTYNRYKEFFPANQFRLVEVKYWKLAGETDAAWETYIEVEAEKEQV